MDSIISRLSTSFRGRGLHAWRTTVSQQATLDIPADYSKYVEVEVLPGQVETPAGFDISWNIAPQLLAESRSSISSGSTKGPEKYKYTHTLISQGLTTGPTDRRLEHIRRLKDSTDSLTPDFIVHQNHVWYVVEVASCVGSARDAKQAYVGKYKKYVSALRDRVVDNATIVFCVIVVTPAIVLSSVELPQETINDLIIRMRISRVIEDKYFRLTSRKLRSDARELFYDNSANLIKEMIEGTESKDSKLGPMPDSQLPRDQKGLVHPLFIDDAMMTRVRERRDIDHSARVTKVLLQLALNDAQEYRLDADKRVDEKIKRVREVYSGRNFEMSEKAVVNAPFIIPKRVYQEDQTSTINDETLVGGTSAITSIWDHAFRQQRMTKNHWKEEPSLLRREAYEEDAAVVGQISKEGKKYRKEWHRVDVSKGMTRDERIELAMDGLWAKKLKDVPSIVEKREQAKKAVHWDSDDEDIRKFLSDKSLLEEMETPDELVHQLLAEAHNLAENSGTSLKDASSWFRTKLFAYLDFLSDVFMELAIANKQNCKSKTLILKRLRRFEAFLLIYPTRSSEHMFWSVFVPSSQVEVYRDDLPFMKMEKNLSGYFSHFSSVKPGKIENKANAFAALITDAAFWSDFYHLPNASVAAFKAEPTNQATHMLLQGLLTHLEDKPVTEEVYTVSRYMFMEVVKSPNPFDKPNPLRLIGKLPDFPRSRLAMFAIKNVIHAFGEMTKHPPKLVKPPKQSVVDEEPLPHDTWIGLLNPYTKGELHTATRAINLAYLGYCVNKNFPPEGNIDFKLVQKILQVELKSYGIDADKLRGIWNPGDPAPRHMAFDQDSVLHGCARMRERLKKTLGEDWQADISRSIYDKLGHKLTEDIATLKASSTLKHENLNAEEMVAFQKVSQGRITVLEAVFKRIQELNLNPYWSFEQILQFVETNGAAIIADLFKKNQHGGLREIFVLTIMSRLCQLFIEVISRELCSYFDEETMTHPDHRTSRLNDHMNRADNLAKQRKCHRVHMCNSMDKSKWSQQLTMPQLYTVLAGLLPAHFHGVVQRVLNLWTNKEIMLPQRVVNLLFKNTELDNETFAFLKQEFQVATDVDNESTLFRYKKDPYIRVRTGMMQGILHYTSSLYHVALLNSFQAIVPPLVKKIYPNCFAKMSQVVSSDDSACILTLFGQEGQEKPTEEFYDAMKMCLGYLRVYGAYASFFGMVDSDKSIFGKINTYEFNSCFRFNNTLAIPIWKWVCASLTLSEASSIIKRLQLMYNLKSDVYQAGLPSYNVSVLEVGQALLHYKAMGSSTNPLWTDYAELLLEHPDPSFGFFPVDSDHFCGLMGMGYSHWKIAQSKPIIRVQKKHLVSHNVEMMEEGGIVVSMQVKMGELAKWKAVKQRMVGEEDLKERIEENPGILFSKAQNLDELDLKLKIKITSPSVGESMMRGNPFLMSLAMSVYMINTHCLSETSLIGAVDPDSAKFKYKKEITKTCLLLRLLQAKEDLAHSSPPSHDQMIMVFPYLERYKDIEQVIEELKNYTINKCHVMKNSRSKIVIQPTLTQVVMSLKEAVTAHWFGENKPYTAATINRDIEYYKSLFSWFTTSIEESLEQSPFETYQELAAFIESYQSKPRSVIRYGPGVHFLNFRQRLLQLGRKTYLSCHIYLKTRGDLQRIQQEAKFNSDLSLAVCIPDSMSRSIRVNRLLKNGPLLAETPEAISLLSKHDKKLAILQLAAREKTSSEVLYTIIEKSQSGILISFVVSQNKVMENGKVSWKGHGTALVRAAGVVTLIHMFDNQCVRIETSSWRSLQRNQGMLEKVMNKLHLKKFKSDVLTHCDGRFDGRKFVFTSLEGTPVIEDTTLLRTHSTSLNYKIEVSLFKIKLVQDREDARGGTVVLTWGYQPDNFVPNFTMEEFSDPWDAWMNQGVWAVEPLLDKLEAIARSLREGGFYKHTDDVVKWYSEVLLMRLKKTEHIEYDIITKGLAEATTQAAEDEQMSELTMDQALEAMAQDLKGKVNDSFPMLPESVTRELDLDILYDEDYTGPFDNQEWLDVHYDKDNSSLRLGAFARRMPFCDSLIDLGRQNGNSWWQRTMRGEIMDSVTESLAHDLRTIYKIPVAETKRKPLEELMLKRKGVVLSDAPVLRTLPKIEPAQASDSEGDSDAESASDESDTTYMASVLATIRNLPGSRITQSQSPEQEALSVIKSRIDEHDSRKAVDKLIELMSMFSLYYTPGLHNRCMEPGLPKVQTKVDHDGKCLFYSLMMVLGWALERLESFLARISGSEFWDFLGDDGQARAAFDRGDYGEAMTLRVVSLEFNVNICVHETTGTLPLKEGKPRHYHYYDTMSSKQTVHLLWSPEAGGFYEGLVIFGQCGIQNPPTSLRVLEQEINYFQVFDGIADIGLRDHFRELQDLIYDANASRNPILSSLNNLEHNLSPSSASDLAFLQNLSACRRQLNNIIDFDEHVWRLASDLSLKVAQVRIPGEKPELPIAEPIAAPINRHYVPPYRRQLAAEEVQEPDEITPVNSDDENG